MNGGINLFLDLELYVNGDGYKRKSFIGKRHYKVQHPKNALIWTPLAGYTKIKVLNNNKNINIFSVLFLYNDV